MSRSAAAGAFFAWFNTRFDGLSHSYARGVAVLTRRRWAGVAVLPWCWA
jgi:multidrug efflux pump subunit AcrB